MGKTIISLRFLKDNFSTVAYIHADELCDELDLDKNKIAKELMACIDMKAFIETYNKYFGDEIKIKI